MRIVIGAPGNGAALKDELMAQLEADSRVSEVVDLSTVDITYPAVSFAAGQAGRGPGTPRDPCVRDRRRDGDRCQQGAGGAGGDGARPRDRARLGRELRRPDPVHGAERHCPGSGEGARRHLARPAARRGEQLRPKTQGGRGVRGALTQRSDRAPRRGCHRQWVRRAGISSWTGLRRQFSKATGFG